jgi:hypothetical protein
MQSNDVLIIAVLLLGLAAGTGFLLTKKPGFGKFNTSILVLLFVLTLSGVMVAGGKLETAVMGHMLFGVVGFATGLFTARAAD